MNKDQLSIPLMNECDYITYKKETELNLFINSNSSSSESRNPSISNLDGLLMDSSTQIIDLDRVNRMVNYKHRKTHDHYKIRVETNLTQIILKEIKQNSKIRFIMLISILIDILIRINCYIELILLCLSQDQLQILIWLLLISPRFVLFLSQIKLFFINLHKQKNQSLLSLAILFRQNFTNEDVEKQSKEEWYKWQKPNQNIDKIGRFWFIILPTEFNFPTLPIRCEENLARMNAKCTYLISGFLLINIEVMIFYPFVLVLFYLQQFYFSNNKIPHAYNTYCIFLVYVVLGKYLAISFWFLSKRNYEINRKLYS